MNDKHDDLLALRAEFEAKFGPCLLRNNTPGPDQGVYLDPFTNYAWRAWQAAYSAGQRAAAVRAAEVCEHVAEEARSTADSKFVTEAGQLIHDGMWGGSKGCAAAILREFGMYKEL